MVSANRELGSDDMTIFFLSGEMLAWPSGGGRGKVAICSKVAESKHLIIPSAQPQTKYLPEVIKTKPAPACKSIHLSMNLSKVNTHKIPSWVRAKTVSELTATLTKLLSRISARSTFLLAMHLVSAVEDEEVVTGFPLSKYHILMFFTPPVTKNSPDGANERERILFVILFEVIRFSCTQDQTNMPLSCSLPIETRYWLSGEKANHSTPYL